MEKLIKLAVALSNNGYSDALNYTYGAYLQDLGIDTTNTLTVANGLIGLLTNQEGIEIDSGYTNETVANRTINAIIGRVINKSTTAFKELIQREEIEVLFNVATALVAEGKDKKLDDEAYATLKDHPVASQLSLTVNEDVDIYLTGSYTTNFPANLCDLMSMFSSLELDGFIDERTANGLFEPFGITVHYDKGGVSVDSDKYANDKNSTVHDLGWDKDSIIALGTAIRGTKELFLKQADDARVLMRKTANARKGEKRRSADVLNIVHALREGFDTIYSTIVKLPMYYLWMMSEDDDIVEIINNAENARIATINKLRKEI